MPPGAAAISIIIPTVFNIILGYTIYYYLKSRHAERMAMIENGIPLNEAQPPVRQNPFGFRLGMLAMGIGLGVFIAGLLDTYTNLSDETVYPAMIFLVGGGALVASYFFKFPTISDGE